MKHIEISKLLLDKKSYLDKEVVVCGWVKNFRDSKNTSFIEINDGSVFKPLQIVVDKDAKNFGEEILQKVLQLGAAIKISGKVVSAFNNKENIEINASNLEVIGECSEDYPIQKKKTGLDFLRTIPHLRVRTNTFAAMFRVRNALCMAIHNFFQSQNFLYIHTPIITGGDCEGAGEAFSVVAPNFKGDFFGKPASLTVSGQMEGEEAAMALGKIYTFAPTFRAENSNTTRHVAEFWMIEPEVAFAELPDIIQVATDMTKYVIDEVMKKCKEEIAFFDNFYEKGLIQKLQNVVDSDFVELDYNDAVEILKKSGKKFNYKVDWGVDLQTEHERYLTDEHFKKPVFVVNYPKDIKAFYMKQNKDEKTVAATDLLVPGIGEIIGCSERETDYNKLLKAMTDRKMNVDDYKNYLDLRKFGSVPHSGFGLGFERLLMYVTGIGNIRDTQLHPRATGDLR